MSKATPATRALEAARIAFTPRPYDYDPGDQRVGLQAAAAVGEPAHLVLKTLVAMADGKPVCLVLPSDREVSLKKVAAALSAKSAAMAPPADAERITGYRIGGVSPFGQKRRLPTLFEISALDNAYVLINGGQRGLLLQLAPADAVQAAGATTAAIIA